MAPLGVYLVDGDFRILHVNPIAASVFGAIEGGVEGRAFDEIMHMLWEQEYANEIVRLFRHTLECGESHVAPERAEFRADRGVTEYYEWRIERITMPDSRGNGGRGFGVVCYFRDISAQVRDRQAIRESEERYRGIVNQSLAGIAETDATGRFTIVNDLYCQITGYSREEMLRLRMQDVTHAEDLPRNLQLVEKLAAEGTPFEIEKRYIRKDRSIVWVHNSVSAIQDAHGSMRSLIAVSVDITKRKRAEEALREADRRKDEFIAMLGHELRNPLGIIGNAVQLLRRVGGPEAQFADVREMIERQVIHTSRMLDDLLDVSRISRGKVQLNKQPWDLRDIVRQTAEDYQSALDENGLRLEMSINEEPLRIVADRTRLSQAVSNLLHNACKFTERSGMIALTVESGSHSCAMLKVRDNGMGIEPEGLGWVFEPFSQADRSLDRSRGGLGLGLSLVKGIVELHGGDVTAASEGPGWGAEFTVRLPLDQSYAKAASAEPESTDAHHSRRILIIEDNRIGARSMRMILEQIGHTVEVAHNGADGIEAARRFRPEVVLCDIGLPGLDGYAVARELRKESDLDGSFLIGVSGYAHDEQRAGEAGFNAYLLKPVNFRDLERMLAKL